MCNVNEVDDDARVAAVVNLCDGGHYIHKLVTGIDTMFGTLSITNEAIQLLSNPEVR